MFASVKPHAIAEVGGSVSRIYLQGCPVIILCLRWVGPGLGYRVQRVSDRLSGKQCYTEGHRCTEAQANHSQSLKGEMKGFLRFIQVRSDFVNTTTNEPRREEEN